MPSFAQAPSGSPGPQVLSQRHTSVDVGRGSGGGGGDVTGCGGGERSGGGGGGGEGGEGDGAGDGGGGSGDEATDGGGECDGDPPPHDAALPDSSTGAKIVPRTSFADHVRVVSKRTELCPSRLYSNLTVLPASAGSPCTLSDHAFLPANAPAIARFGIEVVSACTPRRPPSMNAASVPTTIISSSSCVTTVRLAEAWYAPSLTDHPLGSDPASPVHPTADGGGECCSCCGDGDELAGLSEGGGDGAGEGDGDMSCNGDGLASCGATGGAARSSRTYGASTVPVTSLLIHVYVVINLVEIWPLQEYSKCACLPVSAEMP